MRRRRRPPGRRPGDASCTTRCAPSVTARTERATGQTRRRGSPHPDFLSAVNDDYLRHAIAQGRPGTTMSAWGKDRGGPLSPADIDAIVALMRSWDHAPHVKLDEHLLSGNADPRQGDLRPGVRELSRRARRRRPEHPHREPALPAQRQQRIPALRHRQGTLRHQHARVRRLARPRSHRGRRGVGAGDGPSRGDRGAPPGPAAAHSARTRARESQGTRARGLQHLPEDDVRSTR